MAAKKESRNFLKALGDSYQTPHKRAYRLPFYTVVCRNHPKFTQIIEVRMCVWRNAKVAKEM